MNKIIPFDSFDRSAFGFKHPTFLYSKEHQCIKVDDHYLFLESGEVIKAGDERLNELFGMDFSALIPKTVSDWGHLGVDVISGIADAAGLFTFGGASVASLVIDYLHAVAYVYEATTDAANATSLRIGGAITALFANIPFMGNIGSGIVKMAMRLVGVGGGRLCKYLFKTMPKAAIPAFVRFLKSGGKSIVSKITTCFAKMGEGKLGQMLMKVPAVQKIVNYAKGGGFGKAFSSATTHITTDLAVYSRSTVHEAETMIRGSYKQLDPAVRQMLTMGEYTTMHGHMLQNEITGVAHHIDISKATTQELQQIENSLGKFFSRNISPQDALKEAVGRNLKTINADYLKMLKASAPEAGEKALSLWARLFPKRVVETAAKDTVSLGSRLFSWAFRSLAKRVGRVISRVGKILTKTGISNSLNPDNATDAAAAAAQKEQGQEVPDKYAAGSVGSRGEIGKDELGKDPAQASGTKSSGSSANGGELKTQSVDNKAQLGNLTIAFKTPNKDNTEGKLVLAGEMYEGEIDLSAKLSSYTDRDSLLVDLKLVLDKEDKERIRDGEFTKWERSTTMVTPFVKEDSARYEFYFMVRERSTISLAKKRINEQFDWENILSTEALATGFHKFSNSLYMKILKKDK